ncbi:MAG: 4Fe-4S binding protein [Eggerthella lenta]
MHVGCIALVDGELRVDASKCVGCGTCATVCPTSALEAQLSDAQLAQACLSAVGDEVVVACEQLRRAAAGCSTKAMWRTWCAWDVWRVADQRACG